MTLPATTPPPPYLAVIFTSVRKDVDEAYGETVRHLLELAAGQPGFLGYESARAEIGITVYYWSSLEAIQAWRDHPEHRQAKLRARDWYAAYRVRICKVEREYGF